MNGGDKGVDRRPAKVFLDEYNSDLYFDIQSDGLTGGTHAFPCFSNLWAGCRASLGVNRGRVCFEVTVLEDVRLSMPGTPEEIKHLLRVGWSVASQSYDLGEEQYSYGYGGTGKSSCNNRFADYGRRFGVGDVITCYLDLESATKSVSFAKNGEYLGNCFKLDSGVVFRAGALFPHVMCKNVIIRANFGSSRPAFPILDGFSFIEHLDSHFIESGPAAPRSQADCEVIMMVGLPASGKTTWATNMCARFPEKRYNVVGTNNVIDKMKVMGLNRKRNYHGRWDALMEEAGKVHTKLLQFAQNRCRNFILDQTNVYGSAQKRKIGNFSKFGKRRAVVLVVTNEELNRRTVKREREEGKLVPEEAVMEMKSNFTLPMAGEHFTSVEYVEENKESAQRLVQQLREEATEYFRLNPAKRARQPAGRGRPQGQSPSSPYSTPPASPHGMPHSSPHSTPSSYPNSPYASPRPGGYSSREGSVEPYCHGTPGLYSRESSVEPYGHGTPGSLSREPSVEPYGRGVSGSYSHEHSVEPYGRGPPGSSSREGSVEPYGHDVPRSYSREGSVEPCVYGTPGSYSRESSTEPYGHASYPSQQDAQQSSGQRLLEPKYGQSASGDDHSSHSSSVYNQPRSGHDHPPPSSYNPPAGYTTGNKDRSGHQSCYRSTPGSSNGYDQSTYRREDGYTSSQTNNTPGYSYARPPASSPYGGQPAGPSPTSYGQPTSGQDPYGYSSGYYMQPPPPHPPYGHSSSAPPHQPYGQGSSVPGYGQPGYGHQQYGHSNYGGYR